MSSAQSKDSQKGSQARSTVGQNGVAIATYDYEQDGYRSYEVHQRERVGQSTEKINGAQLASAEYAADPYPLVKILREEYPCYRDWINNCYWITRYDDVTSIFVDEANFESRPKLWYYGMADFGRNLGAELSVSWAWANGMDAHAQGAAETLAANGTRALEANGSWDVAQGFAAMYPVLLLARILDVPASDVDRFGLWYWQAQRGAGWHSPHQIVGQRALRSMCEYFSPIIQQRKGSEGTDLVSAVANSGGSAADLVVTLLEYDHQTLHGALANLCLSLLQQPEALSQVRRDKRLLKIAYLESLRYSPPVITAERFARQEVERFGRLIPQGALMRLSALAANRDPNLFHHADEFVPDRQDICHREARGQYRADGLPTGITFGLGPPTRHPAVPEDRPRSVYAVTRDTAVTAMQVLLEQLSSIALKAGVVPVRKSLSIGEVYTCWELPVQQGP